MIQSNDLVSRQAAIDAINEYRTSAPEYMQGWAHKLIDAVKGDIAEVISALPSAQEWIPCSERLPEDGQWVLVWGHFQENPIMMFRERDAWIDDQFEFYDTVTHWMPLPEPPKQEENETD